MVELPINAKPATESEIENLILLGVLERVNGEIRVKEIPATDRKSEQG